MYIYICAGNGGSFAAASFVISDDARARGQVTHIHIHVHFFFIYTCISD